MALSSSLIGPYDKIPTYDKVRIMCGVPSVISKALFDELFKLRGVQDKILARLFYVFYLEITSDKVQAELSTCITDYQTEEVLNKVLNKIALLQIQHENQDVEPTAEPTECVPSPEANPELHGSPSGQLD